MKRIYGIDCDLSSDDLQNLTNENEDQAEWLKKQREVRQIKEKRALVICGIQNQFCPTGPREIKGVNPFLLDRINWARRHINWDLVIIILYVHPLPDDEPIEDDVNQKLYAHLYKEDSDLIFQLKEGEFNCIPIINEIRKREINKVYMSGHSIEKELRTISTSLHAAFFDVTVLKNASTYTDPDCKESAVSELEAEGIHFISTNNLPHNDDIIKLG